MAAAPATWSSGIPWDQEPAYVAACRSQLQLGDPTSYNPPRNVGATPTDVTGFQIGSAGWSIHNLPAIFYVLWPCTEWRDFAGSVRPGQKVDVSGNLMFERYPWPGTQPRAMIDFPIFRDIDTISTEVEWELVESWMRIDPRITWDDIEMRMEHVGKRASYDHTIDLTDQNWLKQVEKAKANFHNLLNMRTQRQGRVPFNMLSWRNKKAMYARKNKPRDEVLGRLTPQQVAANTTRGATPGLIDVNAPDTAANRVPLPGRRRQQQAHAQVAPRNNDPAHNTAPQIAAPQTFTQVHGIAQPQAFVPDVSQLPTGVPQQGDVRLHNSDVVSSRVAQQGTAGRDLDAAQFSNSQPQSSTPGTMTPSPVQHNQDLRLSSPDFTQQFQPPPPTPQMFDQQYQTAPTRYPNLQTPHQVTPPSSLAQPMKKRTASSAFVADSSTNEGFTDWQYETTGATAPSRSRKRLRIEPRPVELHYNGNDSRLAYEGPNPFLNIQNGRYDIVQPPISEVPPTSTREILGITDGKRKREADDVSSPYEHDYPQQPQQPHIHSSEIPPPKRQQIWSSSPQIIPALPADLEYTYSAENSAETGQLYVRRPLNSRPSLPFPGEIRQSSISPSPWQLQALRYPTLGDEPSWIGSLGPAGPNIRRTQDQGFGDSYSDPMSPFSTASPPLSRRRGHQSGRREGRGFQYPNILAPNTQSYRVTKDTPQYSPSVRGSRSQHFPVNYEGDFSISPTNERPQVLRTDRHGGGADGHGTMRQNTEVQTTQSYANQRPFVPGSYPCAPSGFEENLCLPIPGASIYPPHLHPSYAVENTPHFGSTTLQGPYPTPARVNGTTPRFDHQIEGAQYGHTSGSSLVSPLLQEPLEPVVGGVHQRQYISSEEIAAYLSIDEDGFIQRVIQNPDEHAVAVADSEQASSATEASDPIDEEFFEAFCRNEDQAQPSTDDMTIPEAADMTADFSQTEIERWNAEAEATLKSLFPNGYSLAPSTADTAAPQSEAAQSSAEDSHTEQSLSEDLQEEGTELTEVTEEEPNSLGTSLYGPEAMQCFKLPFDVSEFSVEDELWLRKQDSSDLF